MPVRCLTCNKTFNTLTEVGDHISDTNEGMQGEFDYGPEPPTLKEMEHTAKVIGGFSHTQYINHRGEILSSTLVHVKLMAGIKWCTECRLDFRHNFTLYEHMVTENHGTNSLLEHAKKSMQEFKEIEKRWF
jgi:hypothetical protein